jgi:hypothetical protein
MLSFCLVKPRRKFQPKKTRLNLQINMLQPQKAITVEQIPEFVPRPLASVFGFISKRTLLRAERDGKLTPIRRGVQNVLYRKDELLKFLGIPAAASKAQKKKAA